MKILVRITDLLVSVVLAGALWLGLMLAIGVIWGAGITAFRFGYKLMTNF